MVPASRPRHAVRAAGQLAAVLGAGVLLLAGSLSVLLGVWADLGALPR